MASFGIILALLGAFIVYEAVKTVSGRVAGASAGNSLGGGAAPSPGVTLNPQGNVGGTWQDYIPADWGAGMNWILGRENSSQNPGVVSTLTVNGEHPTGLWQMLPTTFAANMNPGCTNIFDPICNTIAAVNYIARQYGSPSGIPAIGTAGYKGY